MYFHTTGWAEWHLQPCYSAKDGQKYKTYQEMLDWLSPLFTNSFKKDMKKQKYDALIQEDYELFSTFHTNFMFLAVKEGIHPSSYLADIKAKINNALTSKTIYAVMKSTSFKKYC